MNILRLTTLILIFILLMPFEASAHCAGKHTGDHPHCAIEPPPPPPDGCADTFPGFMYYQGGTRKTPGEIRLASSDGCRTELVAVEPEGAYDFQMHMTADRSAGVIVWVEDPGSNNQKIISRLDFTVDEFGVLDVEPAITILPLAGEEPLPGESQYYEVSDIWGDANHSLLYITVIRSRAFSSAPYAGKGRSEALIYDLNVLADSNADPATGVRAIYRHWVAADGQIDSADWLDAVDSFTHAECVDAEIVANPQFSPTCYKEPRMTFNSSGTRLYLEQGLRRGPLDPEIEPWHGIMRIKTDDMPAGEPLANWNLSGPELVYAVNGSDGSSGVPIGALPRPDTEPDVLPVPEILTAGGQFFDADHCVDWYAPYADGNTSLDNEFWLACTAPGLLAHGDARSWESPDSYLFDRFAQQGKAKMEIYRVYVSEENGLADTEELLVENGRDADTGH